MNNQFFFDKKIPFLEVRSSTNSSKYKEHLHDTFSIGALKSGSTDFFYHNEIFTLEENALVIIPPKVVHSCNARGDTPRDYYMLYLNSFWCLQLQQELFPDLKDLKSVSNPILHSQDLYNDFLTLCELLFSNINPQEKEARVISFVSDLFSYFYENDNFKEMEDTNIVERIIEYFKSNLSKNISLDEISKEFGYNKFFLSRIFKKHTSLPPHTYHLNLKINFAKELLKNGEDVAEIAQKLGFVDQSHFHRNFQKQVLATPTSYKKSISYKN